MKQWKRRMLYFFAVIAALVIFVILYMNLAPQFGAKPSGADLERIKQSPYYRDGSFHNPIPTKMNNGWRDYLASMREYFSGDEERFPQKTLPSHPIKAENYCQDDKAFSITWLGHSTVLIEIDGRIIITDPVFEHKPSPVPFFGSTPFPYSNEFRFEDLPEIDIVLISHDHYDHLDYPAILKLKEKDVDFYVPLGVGSHLKRWGIPAEKIHETDWWQEQDLDGLTLTAAPVRHFSGRVSFSMNFQSQFASWAIRSKKHSVYFGGDSGYWDGFQEIGDRLGPFDICLLECGAYSEYWPTIHMFPEQTLQAFLDLKAGKFMPIHWGRYNLALHSWTDPVERVTAAAAEKNTDIIVPRPGQHFFPDKDIPLNRWWDDL